MKKSRKLKSLLTTVGGAATLAVVPLAASSCTWGHSKETKERTYSVVGANDVNVTCSATSKQISLSLKSNVGELITKGVDWSVNKEKGEHSNVSLDGRKYKVHGSSFGDDKYVFTAKYDGKTVTQDLKVNVMHNYIIYGSENVSIQAKQTTDEKELILKDENGNIESDVEWSINKNSQEHSSVALMGNKYKVTGKSYGSETYLFTAKHNGQIVTAPLNVSIREIYISNLPKDPVSVIDGQTVGTTTGDWFEPQLVGETGKVISQGVTWSAASSKGYCQAVFNQGGTKFKIQGLQAGDNDTLTITGEYNGQVVKYAMTVNVAKAYEIKLPTTIASGVTVEVDETKTIKEPLKLMISDTEEYQGDVTWYVENQAADEPFSIAKIVNGNNIQVKGSTFGLDPYKIKATFGNGQEVSCDWQVDVAHKYTVSGIENVALENEEATGGRLLLKDENGNEPGETVTWAFKNASTSLATYENSKGGAKYTITANSNNITGTDNNEVTATFEGAYRTEGYSKSFDVTIKNKLYVQALAAPINVDYNTSSNQQQLKLVYQDESKTEHEITDTQNITWTLDPEEQAKKTYTTINLNANGKFTITGNQATENGVEETHNVIARYKDKEYRGVVKATVNHVYHVEGNDGVSVHATESSNWQELQLKDETGNVITDNTSWSIEQSPKYASAEFKPDETQKIRVNGTSYGSGEVLKLKVTNPILPLSEGEHQIKFDIPVSVTHLYSIPAIDPVTILTDSNTAMSKLILQDETRTEVTDPIEWSVTRSSSGDAHSEFKWEDQSAGTYTIKGTASTYLTYTPTPDTWQVKAKYNGEEFFQTVSVNVHNYKLANVPQVINVDCNAAPTAQTTLQLLDDKDQPLSNVNFSFDAEVKNNSKITHTAGSPDYSVEGTQYTPAGSEDVYTITATTADNFVRSASFKVSVDHVYTISGSSSANMSVAKGASITQTFTLKDEQQNTVSTGVTWAFDENDTREIENDYFKATIGGTTGSYSTLTVEGKAKTTETQTIQIIAKYNGKKSVPYSVTIDVSAMEIKALYNDNVIDLSVNNEFHIAKNTTMNTSDRIYLKLYDGSTAQTSGVTWNTSSQTTHIGTYTSPNNWDTESGALKFNLKANSNIGSDLYTFTGNKNGTPYTLTLKVVVYEPGQVKFQTQNEVYGSTRTCEIKWGGMVSGATVDSAVLKVPAQIGFLKVTKIADNGFSDRPLYDTGLETNCFASIDFSNAINLKEIGKEAFRNNDLKAEISNTLDFSNTKLEKIGDNAFQYACQKNNSKFYYYYDSKVYYAKYNSFKQVIFPKTIKHIGANALGEEEGQGYANVIRGNFRKYTEPAFVQIKFLKPDSVDDVNSLFLGAQWVSHKNTDSSYQYGLSSRKIIVASEYLAAYQSVIGGATSLDWGSSDIRGEL